MAEVELIRVENKTFGPGETVVLDGRIFINCVFEGCDFIYAGEADTAQIGGTPIRNADIYFCGAAQRTINILNALGFNVIDGDGNTPQEQSLQ
jgi:hypothetical protein